CQGRRRVARYRGASPPPTRSPRTARPRHRGRRCVELRRVQGDTEGRAVAESDRAGRRGFRFMTPTPETMLADPRWFLDDMDTMDGTMSFVEVSQGEIMALPFLAQNWDRSG